MMRVVFYDKQRETYHAIGNVVQLEQRIDKVSGRLINLWYLSMYDGSLQTLPTKWFTLHRVEI